MMMDNLTLARRLAAAAVAVEHGGAYENRESLIELCALLQSQLAPPTGDLTWRSHDGRVWKIADMSDEHLTNALGVLLRRPSEGMSPLFPALYDEAMRRLADYEYPTKLVPSRGRGWRKWFRRRLEFISEQGKYCGWIDTNKVWKEGK